MRNFLYGSLVAFIQGLLLIPIVWWVDETYGILKTKQILPLFSLCAIMYFYGVIAEVLRPKN